MTERDRDALLVDTLDVRYKNGVHAVRGVNLEVAPASRLAVMGRNGAGKSTLLRSIAGFLPSDRVALGGSVKFGNREILGQSCVAIGDRGVAYVPERDKVFPGLTVDEHFRLFGGKRPDVTLAVGTFPKLEALRGKQAGFLSGGERQMLALACAVIRKPRLLLVDELSLGLAPVVIKEVSARLAEIQQQMGFALVLVDMNRGVVDGMADHVLVLDHGQIVAAGSPAEISAAAWLTTHSPANPEAAGSGS